MGSNGRGRFVGLGVGAVLPAVGVSLTWFCCLPIAAGLLGVGMAGLGAKMMALRPILSGISLLFLGLAFYKAYRPQPCLEGGCATPVRRRGSRVLVWVMAVAIGVLLTIQHWSSWLIYWTY